MQTRRDFLIAASALGLAAPALPGALPAPLPSPLRIPVWIDGRGPFPFIVDTGASRSALAAHCLPELPRSTRPEDRIRLRTQTGSVDVPTVSIGALATAAGAVAGLRRLPVLPRQALVSADGLLGADAFSGARLHLDFVAATADLSRTAPSSMATGAGTTTDAVHGRSRTRRPVEVPVTFDAVGRALVDTRVGRAAVRALIDTGAQRSIAAPGLSPPTPAAAPPDETSTGLRGAAGALLPASESTLPVLRIGARRWPAGPVLVAPLSAVVPPANGEAVETLLLLGLDRLAALEWLTLDYARARLTLSPLRGGTG